jgi:predicted RNA-binding protein with TRAM domain
VRPNADFIGNMTVRYRVRDVTGDPSREVEGRISVRVSGVPDAPVPPRIGEVRDRTVVLSWTAPDNRNEQITEYRVTAQPGSVVRTCASTTCTIDGLTNDVEYTFTVAAKNRVGWSEESPRSAPARPDAVPEKPAPPRLIFGDRSITATWTAPVSNGSPITSYSLLISPAPESGSATRTTSSLSYTFDGLRNGDNYTVQVRAHNRAPEPGAWSDSSAAESPAARPSAPAPSATKGQIDVLGNGTIEVVWAGLSRTEAGGADIQRYEVSVDGGTALSVGTQTSYRFTEAQRGRTYTFDVRAVNKAGDGAWGRDTGQIWSVPGALSSLTATPSGAGDRRGYNDGQVTLSWSAPSDDGGAPISGYEIEGVGRFGANVTRHTLAGVAGGSTPTYRVRAINQRDLAGEWRSVTSATVVTAPGPVANVALGEPARDGDRQPTSITATWSAVDWAGSDGTYTVEFFVDGRRTDRQENVSGTSATSSAGMPRFGFFNRSATFRAVVTPLNAAGSGSAGAAERVVSRASEPGAVSDSFPASVSSDGRSVSARWNPPGDTGGATIVGYKVQVKVGDGEWTDLPRAGSTRVDNQPLPTTAEAGVTVTVRVKAVNQYDQESQDWGTSSPYVVPQPQPTPEPTPDPPAPGGDG